MRLGKLQILRRDLDGRLKHRKKQRNLPNHVVLLTVLIAEGLALREALARCRELGLRRIRCESDSRESHPELYGILSDVFSFSSSFDFISLSWIPRGMNKAADKFAKQCLVEEEAFMADT
ncbi:hypothetical protein DY000_02038948 [Brassica cretica]|uniref:RNase H type-1 domain-containing protein n=1 Tax=Brassica cretica TaxID=69181 RepID=A0ABQ7BKY3_BRACR|nr:hypothetical protein DY000_02038948 [Brassica cretica]